MKLLLRFLKPYRGLVALILLVLLIDNAGTLLVPTMLADMVNVGLTSGDMEYILRGAAGMLVATAMASGGAVTGAYLSARLSAYLGRDIRNAIYDASLRFSSADFERFGTGSMITRSLNDINVIQQAVVMTIQLVLPVPFLCAVGFVLACAIDYQMGILLASTMAMVLVIAVLTVAKAAPIFIKLQGYIDRMNTVLRESIVGVRVIRAFGKERREEERLDEVLSKYADNAVRMNWMFAGLDCSSFFIVNIAEVVILWLGGNRVGAHAMQIASISAILEYAMIALFFIMMAQMVALTLPRAKVCLDRAAEVIDHVPEIRDGEGAPTADVGRRAPLKEAEEGLAAEPDIVAQFDHATFRFPDADEDTLHDLCFSCRRGTTTAIIGSTGSGKSTVAKLLLRFHDVTGGTVRVAGRDVRAVSQHDLRSRIAFIPQKAWLFSGTIASNLADGCADVTREQMERALRIAQAGFVFDLPQGLQTRVAQGGTNFSGGQRQRLAIARALMKRAELYIFDDSFSALDFRTDAALRAALATEMGDAAMVIIAQRVSTILHADQIVVLKDGCVAGAGTHEELMETCEVYRDIAASQMVGGERHDA